MPSHVSSPRYPTEATQGQDPISAGPPPMIRDRKGLVPQVVSFGSFSRPDLGAGGATGAGVAGVGVTGAGVAGVGVTGAGVTGVSSRGVLGGLGDSSSDSISQHTRGSWAFVKWHFSVSRLSRSICGLLAWPVLNSRSIRSRGAHCRRGVQTPSMPSSEMHCGTRSAV